MPSVDVRDIRTQKLVLVKLKDSLQGFALENKKSSHRFVLACHTSQKRQDEEKERRDEVADSGSCRDKAVFFCFCYSLLNNQRKVSRLVAKYRQTGNIKDLNRSGRPKVTTEREDRLIVQRCRRHR